MQRHTRGRWSFCLLLGVLFLLTGCSNKKRVILLTNGDDPFWDVVRSGMKDAERDFKLSDGNLKVEVDKNDATPKGQIDKLTQYANQTDIAAVAISATDAKNTQLADAMRQLIKQGIQVITLDSDVDRDTSRDARFAYLGTDNLIGGRELGKAAKGLRPAGGNYAAFVGLPSASNATGRMQGFVEGTGSQFKQIEYLADKMDRSVAQKNVRDAIDRHPEINTLLGIWSYDADAIARTVKELGVRDKVTVVTFDASPDAIPDMADGFIDAMVVQNPYQMGYDGVRLMKALVDGDQATIHAIAPEWDVDAKKFKSPDGDVISTEIRVVVPDEKSPLKPELFEASTKFFTLPEFKKWLDERKLKSS
jgi:ribose transport system substrate-binding protein